MGRTVARYKSYIKGAVNCSRRGQSTNSGNLPTKSSPKFGGRVEERQVQCKPALDTVTLFHWESLAFVGISGRKAQSNMATFGTIFVSVALVSFINSSFHFSSCNDKSCSYSRSTTSSTAPNEKQWACELGSLQCGQEVDEGGRLPFSRQMPPTFPRFVPFSFPPYSTRIQWLALTR